MYYLQIYIVNNTKLKTIKKIQKEKIQEIQKEEIQEIQKEEIQKDILFSKICNEIYLSKTTTQKKILKQYLPNNINIYIDKFLKLNHLLEIIKVQEDYLTYYIN